MSVLPVFINGFGCLSAIGTGLEETTASLRESRSGIAPVRLFDVKGAHSQTAGQVTEQMSSLAAEIHTPARRWGRGAQMVLIAFAEALRNRPDFSPDFVVMGTTSGGMDFGEQFMKAALTGRPLDHALRQLRQYVPQQPVLDACRALGLRAPVRVVSNACASGTNALGVGYEMIRSGRARRVLVGGYDALAQLVFAGFDCLRASTDELCRPFDSARTGLALGEGAAAFCLEAHEGLIRIAGYGSSTDTHHFTQPNPTGAGARSAMQRALAQAGMDGQSIDYINAHGTGTPLNDACEARAIQDVCPQAAVSSTKGATGHALGAAGAIEAAFSCISLREGFLPATLNFRQPDPDVSLDLVVNESRSSRPRRVMSNSFGFGGANASIIFESTSRS